MKRAIFLLALVILLTGFGDGDAINNGRGNKYFRKGDYKKALEYYGKIRNGKNKIISEFNRGNALVKSGKLKEGLNLLGDVASNGNRNIASEAYYNMGNALFRAGKYNQAVGMYVNSLKLSPGSSNVKYNLEKALRMLRRQRQKNKNNKNKKKKNKKKNKNKPKNGKNKNKNKSNGNGNHKKNQLKNKENTKIPQAMTKKEAERILNALMRNRKNIKKDSTAYKKFLNPRYTW